MDTHAQKLGIWGWNDFHANEFAAKVPIMHSQNFEFLRENYSELADLPSVTRFRIPRGL